MLENSSYAHLQDVILERLANGESLKEICRTDGFPSEGLVRLWSREEGTVFATRYIHARNLGCEILADQLLEISDDTSMDMSEDENGRKRVDHEHIQRSRLRVDTRKWILARMLPKKYGERLELAGEVKTDNVMHITREVVERAKEKPDGEKE